MSYYQYGGSPIPLFSLGMLIDVAILLILIVGSLASFGKCTTLPLIVFGIADISYSLSIFGKTWIPFNSLIAVALILGGALFVAVGVRRKLNSE